MTDTEVESILISTFETIGSPFLTSITTNGTTKYTNVAYENKSFTRPNNGYWFELHFIPSAPYQQELGKTGKNRWYGIFQINICVPKNVGTTSMQSRFNKIFSVFPRGFLSNGINIKSVARTSARTEDDYMFLPVSIAWQADLSNQES